MLLMLKLMKKAIVPTITHMKLYHILLTLYLPNPKNPEMKKLFLINTKHFNSNKKILSRGKQVNIVCSPTEGKINQGEILDFGAREN